MESVHKKFLDELLEAEKLWQSADHFIYITLPVVKDNKLMVRALENLYRCLVIVISNILKFEYLYKRVSLSKDSGKNLDVFFSKCSLRYGILEDDAKILKDIVFLGKKHKESGFEFSRQGKVIILDDSLKSSELSVEKMKIYLRVVRKLLENTNKGFRVVY